MIVQGSNIPIVITFSDDPTAIKDISIVLVKNGKILKQWTKDMLTIDQNEIYCSLTQEETMVFPIGHCEIKLKWLDQDGMTEFSETYYDQVIEWPDRTLLTEGA